MEKPAGGRRREALERATPLGAMEQSQSALFALWHKAIDAAALSQLLDELNQRLCVAQLQLAGFWAYVVLLSVSSWIV